MASFSTENIARASTHHPWLTIGIWVLVIVGAIGAAGALLGDALTTDQELLADVEARRGDDALGRGFGRERVESGLNPDGENETVVIQSDALTVDDPAFRAVVEEVTAEIRALGQPDIAAVVSFYESGDESLVSEDRRTTILPVITGPEDTAESAERIMEILHEHDGVNGFVVATGGQGSIDVTFNETAEKDLQEGEFQIGLPAAMVIVVIVFGALVASTLPLAVAIVSIVLAIGLTALVGQRFDISIFAINVITTIGLAVGIDYSLLMVQRFREERAKGLELDEAIARMGGTATKAVIFSGLSVIAALSGLLIVPDSIFRSLGLGAILVTVAAILSAVTLLPAILHLLGDRVNALHIGLPRRASGGAFWTRTSSFVMHHPVIAIVVTVAILVAASLPYFTIETGQSGVSSLPQGSSPRVAFEILDEEFSAGGIQPALVAVEAADVSAEAVQSATDELVALMGQDAAFGEAEVVANQAGTVLQVSVPVQGDAQEDEAREAVMRLREEYVPAAFAGVDAEVNVTGYTARILDYSDMINWYTPWVFIWVLGLSFVILLVVFRSIVVPIKALVMNLLSVGAAYGLMVLVFQHGFAADLLGFNQVDRIEAWVPLFLFAILFGLSMDYHVFLLSRIRERYDETHDNRESVAFGIRSTAGMITGAAAIMVAVFSGFALGQLVMFQQMGFGLAVAILLDATIIRVVLVPASMALLGDANWYLPSWLGWLPKLDIEGRAHAHADGAAPVASEA